MEAEERKARSRDAGLAEQIVAGGNGALVRGFQCALSRARPVGRGGIMPRRTLLLKAEDREEGLGHSSISCNDPPQRSIGAGLRCDAAYRPLGNHAVLFTLIGLAWTVWDDRGGEQPKGS